MSVELWYGERPTNLAEQNVLIELYDYLKHREQHYVLMSNFRIRNEIDLIVLKKDGIFLTELKHCWDPVFGGDEGNWVFKDQGGAERSLKANPLKQVIKCSQNWRDWFEENLAQITPSLLDATDKRPHWPFLYAVFYPHLHPASEIETQGRPPIEIMGLDKFRTALPIRADARYAFTPEEMRKIPELLQLTRWHIDPPRSGRATLPIEEGDIRPPIVRMLVPRDQHAHFNLVHIEGSLLTIGREPKADLAISDESVSRKHAEISFTDNHWVVKDLNSKNGTFVSYNGDPKAERRVEGTNAIKNGSIIRFGQISYTVILDEA